MLRSRRQNMYEYILYKELGVNTQFVLGLSRAKKINIEENKLKQTRSLNR